MHDSAYRDAAGFAAKYLAPGQHVLDLGSLDVNGTLRPIVVGAGCTYVGADIRPGKNVDIVLPHGSEWGISIADQRFDVVMSSQTFEHVLQPWETARAVFRVLRPNGLFYVCAPNTHKYHPYPVDCFRFFPEGLKAVLEWAGFTVFASYARGADTTAIGRKQ